MKNKEFNNMERREQSKNKWVLVQSFPLFCSYRMADCKLEAHKNPFVKNKQMNKENFVFNKRLITWICSSRMRVRSNLFNTFLKEVFIFLKSTFDYVRISNGKELNELEAD